MPTSCKSVPISFRTIGRSAILPTTEKLRGGEIPQRIRQTRVQSMRRKEIVIAEIVVPLRMECGSAVSILNGTKHVFCYTS
mmetsp:Transcript_61744/g.145235  ORF Transcript_61744/g.145235 Transcript_61744/m.145235 type:complete len:81 (-) Transcript_61744:667-909(-)